MRAVGIMSTVAGTVVVVGAVVLAVRSLPDVRRYLKMRSM
jgi:hypothetical protein